MNITLNLTQEESDALAAKVSERNALNPEVPYTPESHLTECVMGLINGYTTESYNAAVRRIGEAAAVLPYEQRLALIAQVEGSLS